MRTRRSGKAHAKARWLWLVAPPVLYLLSAPIVGEVTLLRHGSSTAWMQAYSVPYDWARDHTPLRIPLIAYWQGCAQLPVFDRLEEDHQEEASPELVDAP